MWYSGDAAGTQQSAWQTIGGAISEIIGYAEPKEENRFFFRRRTTGEIQDYNPVTQLAPYLFDWWKCADDVPEEETNIYHVFIIMEAFDGILSELFLTSEQEEFFGYCIQILDSLPFFFF